MKEQNSSAFFSKLDAERRAKKKKSESTEGGGMHRIFLVEKWEKRSRGSQHPNKM